MPRPHKCRKVCHLPQNCEFYPISEQKHLNNAIVITVDEYESIRLIDYEGFSQEECGKYMKIARTTVQLIYNNARKKISDALVNGRRLRIEGGNYRLCDGKEPFCSCGGCKKHQQTNKSDTENNYSEE